ncbi:unnamed protein product [Musa acuminata subsp. burmannicoides]
MADRGCDDACGCAVPCPGDDTCRCSARRGEVRHSLCRRGDHCISTRAHAGGRWFVPPSDARHARADLIAAARHVPPPDEAKSKHCFPLMLWLIREQIA